MERVGFVAPAGLPQAEESDNISDAENQEIQRNNNSNVPCFEPKATDVFSGFPEVGTLISYIWTREPVPVYRTGVLKSRNGTICFFDDSLDEHGRPMFVQWEFHLTKKKFEANFFRPRGDLQVGNFCYDEAKDQFCQLLEIDVSHGGVSVMYTNQKVKVLVSPDFLVGVPPALYNLETQRRNKKRKDREDDLSPFSQKTQTHRAATWYGVFEGKQQSQNGFDSFYIRGKLQEDPLPGRVGAFLVQGECVQHCSRTGNFGSQLLKFNFRLKRHELVSKNDGKCKKQCMQYVKMAEENYAKIIKTERRNRRVNAALSFRPLQPVRVTCTGGAMENGVVMEPKNATGWVKVRIDSTGALETKRYSQVSLIGEPEKMCLDDFFRVTRSELPKQKESYRAAPDFLLRAWEAANQESMRMKQEFARHVEARKNVRELAGGLDGVTTPTGMSAQAMKRLENRSSMLLLRLQEDFRLATEESLMTSSDFRSRIIEVKNILPHANLLLLCGGFAPEVTAYKRLGAAPLGKVILQDTDLRAVGVAVAGHPDVEFQIVVDPVTRGEDKGRGTQKRRSPGDVRILRNPKVNVIREVEVAVGGIHGVGFTNPCTPFSLAGKKNGFADGSGMLLIDCCQVVRSLEESSSLPLYLGENVPSTTDLDAQSDTYLPLHMSAYFRACGSMVSPSQRDRKFATNRPPPVCAGGPNRYPGEPPMLDGDCPEVLAQRVIQEGSDRIVHPGLKKFPCLTRSGPMRTCVWQRQDEYSEPIPSTLLPEEAERAMGYKEHEIGVTALSAEAAVRKRIAEHDVERDGCIISLKDCAQEIQPEKLSDSERLALLGNSQVVTLLEALLWNERELFPAVTGVE